MVQCVIHLNSLMRPQSNYCAGEQKAIESLYTADKEFNLHKSGCST